MKKRIFKILGIILSVLILFVSIASQIPVGATQVVVTVETPIIQKAPISLQPQDNHTRTLLLEQGIDPEYVELVQDYGKTLTVEEKAAKDSNPLTKNTPDPTPYAQTFKDNISGKYIYEVQGLPMVNVNGQKCDTSWNTIDGKNFTAGINQFTASVATTKVTVIALNDQPDGKVKKDTVLVYQPQLYLGVKEVKTTKTTILSVDPINENYLNNTLEWDYGICVRHLRLIEGSLQGSWVFTSNPGNSIRIVYNQTPANSLKLGQYATDADTETIPKSVFDSAQYPFTVGDSQTFYPDTNSAGVDGVVWDAEYPYLGWNGIVTAAGTDFDYTSAISGVVRIRSSTDNTLWQYCYRSIYVIDTSGLPDNATVTDTTFSIRGQNKDDILASTPTVNIYSSSPTSNTALQASDYGTLGSTTYCDTPITYAGWNISDYNNFIFNATGIAAISLTGVTKLGARNVNYDVANSSPPWSSSNQSRLSAYYTEQGTGYKPKLVVTYTLPAPPTITISAATLNKGTTARLNGNITDTGGDNPTVTVYWGDNDGGQTPGNWDNAVTPPTSPAQPQGVAAFYHNVTGLTPSTTYYFSASANNVTGTGWPAASLSFKSASLIAKIMGIALASIGIIW
jgi:hypothetical protein